MTVPSGMLAAEVMLRKSCWITDAESTVSGQATTTGPALKRGGTHTGRGTQTHSNGAIHLTVTIYTGYKEFNKRASIAAGPNALSLIRHRIANLLSYH